MALFFLYFLPRNFTFEDAHCEGARVIAKAAREAGVKRLIHVSALNASEDSPSNFLQSKVNHSHTFSFLIYGNYCHRLRTEKKLKIVVLSRYL